MADDGVSNGPEFLPRRVTVLGAGSWGTAMAASLVRKVPAVLWARRRELAVDIRRTRRNSVYLPDLDLPPALDVTSDVKEALDGADLVVMATPSHGFRDVLAEASSQLVPGVPVVSLTKGVEQSTMKRMSQIIADEAPGHPCGVLTGPNLVAEVVAGYPTASVVSARDAHGDFDPVLASQLQQLFSTDAFRVYTNSDLIGCELGGSLKNVVAVASGMADGLGFGDNTRAALITRGLAELTRLGVALGGRPLTFSGLTGMGDLVATCTSRKSRNRWVGEQLGRGRSIEDISATTRMVAEGVRTSKAVVELAAAAGLEVPIAEQVVAVIYGGQKVTDSVEQLMRRVMKAELHGIV